MIKLERSDQVNDVAKVICACLEAKTGAGNVELLELSMRIASALSQYSADGHSTAAYHISRDVIDEQPEDIRVAALDCLKLVRPLWLDEVGE